MQTPPLPQIPQNQQLLRTQIARKTKLKLTRYRSSIKQVISSNKNIEPTPPIQYLPSYKMSQKSCQVINRSFTLFNKNLQQSKQYLQKLDSKVQRVYKLQALRAELKARQYKNILNQLEKCIQNKEEERNKVEIQALKDYEEIMGENQRLRQLRDKYQQILQKQEGILEKEKGEYQKLIKQNHITKQNIKQNWKALSAQQYQIKNITNTLDTSNINNDVSMKNMSKIKLPLCGKQRINNKNNITNDTSGDKSMILEESSLYITRNDLDSQPNSKSNSKQKDNDKDKENMQIYMLKQNDLLRKTLNTKKSQKQKQNLQKCPSIQTRSAILTIPQLSFASDLKLSTNFNINLSNNNSSMNVYQQAIKKIQHLEESIINSKKVSQKEKQKQKSNNNNNGKSKSKNNKNINNQHNHRPELSQQAIHKIKIKQKIQEIQYTIQMLKLFIIYLKNNQNLENFTGLDNLRKIICYFQKIMKSKEQILSTVRAMGKNFHL